MKPSVKTLIDTHTDFTPPQITWHPYTHTHTHTHTHTYADLITLVFIFHWDPYAIAGQRRVESTMPAQEKPKGVIFTTFHVNRHSCKCALTPKHTHTFLCSFVPNLSPLSPHVYRVPLQREHKSKCIKEEKGKFRQVSEGRLFNEDKIAWNWGRAGHHWVKC